MPLNAFGWSNEEDEKLAELVEPHSCLYSVQDPSRKNILARETTWQEIGTALSKPVEECKKRWRGLRDGYMRIKRNGTLHRKKVAVFEKLFFLDDQSGITDETVETVMEEQAQEQIVEEQEVLMDSQGYYEITVVSDILEQQELKPSNINLLQKPVKIKNEEPPKKIIRKSNAGRKKSVRIPPNINPVKILPKPAMGLNVNGPKFISYIEDNNMAKKVPKSPEQRTDTIDKLIERVLKEHTNEIDVFFRSMAASVKKLQPNLIPKVKMEVCNVIAKYEMQSFDK